MDAPSRCVAGPVRAVLSPCQEVQLHKPLPQDKRSWRSGAFTRPILAGTSVGGVAFLERTSRVIDMALTRGARSGGRHVSREVGLSNSSA